MERLDAASTAMEDAGSTLREFVTLLARSRKVEPDIVSEQFGALIEPGKLSDMKKDLEDLQVALNSVSPRNQ